MDPEAKTGGRRMNTDTLAARVDELNRVAEHVPAEVLARRLTEIVDTFLEKQFHKTDVDSLMDCFGVYAEKICTGRSHDATGTISHYHPLPPPGIITGPPCDPEVHEEWGRLAEAYVAAAEVAVDLDTDEHFSESDHVDRWIEVPAERRPPLEETKSCKECEAEKPLWEYTKHNGFTDGLDNRCKSCRSRIRRESRIRRLAKKDNKVDRTAGPEQDSQTKTTDQAKPSESFVLTTVTEDPDAHRVVESKRPPAITKDCRLGVRCVKYDENDITPAPARLSIHDTSTLCPGCRDRAGL